jgi:hypothetical protein
MTMDLRVNFLGVCTHMQWKGSIPTCMNRVVLVNATAGDRIAGEPIQSHIPTLRIAARHIIDMESLSLPKPGGDIVEWRLDGVRVRIENATDEIRHDETFGKCIPALGKLTSDVGVPSKAAVHDDVKELASCIFDVTGGTLYGATNEHGAAYAVLETATGGNPRVSITSFQPDGTRLVLNLHPGAEISLSNLGATKEHDSHFDFYLHYKLAAEMPPHPQLPLGPPCQSNRPPGHTWPPGFQSVDVGCSNSIYP